MTQPASTAGLVSDVDKLDILDQVVSEVSQSGSQVAQSGSQVAQSGNQASQVSTQFSDDPLVTAISPTTDDSQPSVLDQVIPGVALQATDTLNPLQSVTTGKERVNGSSVLDSVATEAGGLGQVETEKVPELPVEVEGYLQHVEDHHDQLTQEVVVTGNDITLQPSHRPTAPVVVLPITEEEEKLAEHKNTSYGIKWLVEWSHKLIKRFAGKIIYRVK